MIFGVYVNLPKGKWFSHKTSTDRGFTTATFDCQRVNQEKTYWFVSVFSCSRFRSFPDYDRTNKLHRGICCSCKVLVLARRFWRPGRQMPQKVFPGTQTNWIFGILSQSNSLWYSLDLPRHQICLDGDLALSSRKIPLSMRMSGDIICCETTRYCLYNCRYTTPYTYWFHWTSPYSCDSLL